jgi:Tfp pilus assembly protein PilN
MASINLISGRRSERVRMTKLSRGLMGGLIVTCVVSAAAIGIWGLRIVAVQGEIAKVDEALAKLLPTVRQIEQAEADRRELQPKLTTLTEAQTRTQRWFGIMEGFKKAVPEETWLTNVAVESSGEESKIVRIDGITANQSRVGETMYRLTQQPEFYKKVDLRYTQTARGQDKEGDVEFELAAHLYLPEVEAKLQEKAKRDAAQTN